MPPQYHSYKMKNRPFGIGCQPAGHVMVVDADKKKNGYWSIVTYARMLKDDEVAKYELEYLAE